jgi:hypothetical protein
MKRAAFLFFLGFIGCAYHQNAQDTADTGAPANEDALAEPKTTTTCMNDNDWSGSGNCSASSTSLFGSWTYAYSTIYGYYYDDVRYTTSTMPMYIYQWKSPGNGTATFYAWIPSNNATALTNYWYLCGGGTMAGPTTIDQNSIYSSWVRIGSVSARRNDTCMVTVGKTGGQSSTKKAAADAMKVVFTY